MASLKPESSRVLILLAVFLLAGISAQASQDSFVVAVGPHSELLSGAGSGYNGGQWYSYPTGWQSQWFNNAPFDPGRKAVIGLRVSVEPLDSALPSRIIITYGWSTPQWSALGSATPPLPGVAPEGTYIQRHVAFQGYLPAGAKPIPVADTYEIRQYNPQWLSIDVQGENFVVTDGWIKHECLPRTASDIVLLQGPEACCFTDGHCENLTPSACKARMGVPQGPGTMCLGDKNGNRIDDACEEQPTQCAPRDDGQGCLQVTCPISSDICVPTKIRVDYKSTPPRYTVLSCACQSPNLCHVAISSSGSVYCTGGCPAGQQCDLVKTDNGNNTFDYECRCTTEPQPTEACCLPDGTCVDVDRQTCLQRGGTPQGPGTNCNTVVCPQPLQACCLPDGTCVDTDPATCQQRGGTPQGPGTNCNTVVCPQPLEACCLPDGTCTDTTANDCRAKGGTPQGPGTNCNTVVCPQPVQACCLPDGTCIDTTANDCRAKAGTPQGPGTNCKTVKCLPPGECDWNQGDPHKMHFPQLPDLQGWDVEVPPTDVADDWKCSETGPVTDIHFWYSWKGDNVGIIDRIHASIYSNNPDFGGYSAPGDLLWEGVFGPADFDLRHWATGNQGFMNWRINIQGWIMGYHTWTPNDHKDIYQCNICNITDPFTQQAGQIYWLVLSITIRDPVGTHIGWKTSLDHFEDDAVYWGAPTGIWHWRELRDPQTEKSLDLAFVITGREEAPAPPPVVEHTKWSQPPIEIDPKAKTPFYCGWDELSFAIRPSSTTAVLPTVWNIAADDFRCLGSMPVTSVHWWGSYQGWDGTESPAVKPVAWRIGFWSNVPANPLAKPGHSYPKKLLWRVDVPAQRVQEERAGFDQFPQNKSDTCFRYYIKFEPQEYFWQQKYIDSATGDDVFWISITAIYPPVTIPFQQWGWKTRPQHWMDDAVKFTVEGDLPLGYVNDLPLIFTPIEAALCGQQQSFDMAFELDTDPSYIKWEQAFTGIRQWTHYADEESLAFALATDGQKQQLQIRRLVADDWPCEQITPITAAVWWGSYIGYRYKACDCPLMAAPLKPDYFLLSIWTDVRPAANAPFSRPGEKIWEYKAENYDEVLVGYDKKPETVEPGQTPGYEPVFRYSVRLPRDKWFCQKDLNSIYWFSVVAVYAGDKTPLHPWGWTNHPRVDWQVNDPTVPPNIVRNDDAVAGYLDTTGATAVWKWQELHDQTGVSTDMSFILFTEPGCFPCTYSTYADWLALGKPNCWCEPPYGSGYQCDGDADGIDSGGINKFRVFTGDLSLIVVNWRKKAGDATLNPCADIDHKDSGGINKFRVFTGDLSILVANWRKKDAGLPGDCPRPE